MVNNTEFAVEHIGTVVSTDRCGHIAMVTVSRREDCAGCKIANLCRSDSALTVRATVRSPRADSTLVAEDAHGRRRLSEGDQVKILANRSAGMRAVMFLFMLPLAAMVATIAGMSWCSDVTEGVTALSSLGAVGVTYLILWVLRRRIDRRIEWHIVEIIDRAADS